MRTDAQQEPSPSVSRLFSWMVDTDEMPESPMAKMKPPRVPEKMVPVIKPEDLRKLLRILSGTDFESRRDKAIVSLFIDTGLRIAEMAGINVDDIDMEERQVVVMGKGRRSRSVRFVKESRSDITRYLLRRAQHPHAENDALWVGKRGRMQPNGIYQMIVRRCEEAGLERIHPHMFRHSFATHLLESSEFSQQVIDQNDIEVFTTQVCIAVGRLDLKNTLLHPQDGNIECPTTS